MFVFYKWLSFQLPSVHWCCWLGGRKGIQPVRNWVVRCWHGYLPGARCRLAYGPADAMPLTVSCFRKIHTGFTFLVPAHLGSPWQRAVKWVCVCMSVFSDCVVFYGDSQHVTNTAYWPEVNKSVEHCHSGKFKYDSVGASNAKVPACTIGNLQ